MHHLPSHRRLYRLLIMQAERHFPKSKKFMTGCVILFSIAITFYITWWFIRFVDGFFSLIYAQLRIKISGLGFIKKMMEKAVRPFQPMQ